jgi:hypothetical protein
VIVYPATLHHGDEGSCKDVCSPSGYLYPSLRPLGNPISKIELESLSEVATKLGIYGGFPANEMLPKN